jgi:hypothetical protein
MGPGKSVVVKRSRQMGRAEFPAGKEKREKAAKAFSLDL